MSGFSNATDICNRGLQRLGSKLIAAGALTTEDSKQAQQANALYDKVRRAELRRNPWRFATRRVILRAIGTPFPDWSAAVTYATGQYITGSDSNSYVSAADANLNHDPTTDDGSNWTLYTGTASQKVTPSAWSSGSTYAQGALATGSDGLVYLSLAASNTSHDPTTDTGLWWVLYFGSLMASAWDSTESYALGELVFSVANTIYASTMNSNTYDPATGTGWATIACTAAPIYIAWPAGTGPATDLSSRNVFALPNGFLTVAAQDPHAGDSSYLGFPSNLLPVDWLYEGGYLISRDAGPIMFRFVADVAQVTLMDDMFCEGLAARIALELCETMTNSTAKLQAIGQEYNTFMKEARARSGIETGPVQPPLDDYIACRV